MKKILLIAALSIATTTLFGCGGGGGDSDGDGLKDSSVTTSETTVITKPPATTNTTPTAGATAGTTPTPGITAGLTPTPGTTATTGGGTTTTTTAPTDPTSTKAAAVAGFYQGATSNGYILDTLVLPDGRYLGLYWKQVGGVRTISGFIRGTGNALNGSFTGAGRGYDIDTTVSDGRLSASYRDNATINGTYNQPAGMFSFSGTALSTALYDFNRAPRIAEIQGTWSMPTLSEETLAVTIGADGKFTGTNGSCAFAGTLAPNAAGKNVFEVSMQFGKGCPTEGLSAIGAAISSLQANGARRLVFAVTASDGTFGDVFVGIR